MTCSVHVNNILIFLVKAKIITRCVYNIRQVGTKLMMIHWFLYMRYMIQVIIIIIIRRK